MKLRVKLGGPPSKAKYSYTTDSEPVRRLKGEKNRFKRSSKNLKPCIYKQSKHDAQAVRPRTFCIMDRRVIVCGKAKPLRGGAAAKASLNRAFSRRR